MIAITAVAIATHLTCQEIIFKCLTNYKASMNEYTKIINKQRFRILRLADLARNLGLRCILIQYRPCYRDPQTVGMEKRGCFMIAPYATNFQFHKISGLKVLDYFVHFG
jgi:hypothetical protein